MKNQGRSKFTLEEQIQIIQEYESGDMSLREIGKKYGLHGHSIIPNWRKRLLEKPKNLVESKKSCTFAPEIKPQAVDEEPMKKQTPEELEAEVKRLTKELEWAKLQYRALNVLIDIAEKQGIQIRKKSGAKQ